MKLAEKIKKYKVYEAKELQRRKDKRKKLAAYANLKPRVEKPKMIKPKFDKKKYIKAIGNSYK